MKRAGNFLMTDSKAYKDEDGSEYACRASYHILMTDGMWNNQPSGSTNYDGSLDYPYKDEQANTLADWAYHYWATDLRPNLANRVKPYFLSKQGTPPTTKRPSKQPSRLATYGELHRRPRFEQFATAKYCPIMAWLHLWEP